MQAADHIGGTLEPRKVLKKRPLAGASKCWSARVRPKYRMLSEMSDSPFHPKFSTFASVLRWRAHNRRLTSFVCAGESFDRLLSLVITILKQHAQQKVSLRPAESSAASGEIQSQRAQKNHESLIED